MRWVLCFKRLDFATENALFWGFFGVLLQDFTKIQNLMSLNISVLQLNLCVFANLHLRNCFRSAIETKFHCAHLLAALCFCVLQMRTCSRSAIETKFHCAHLLAALRFCIFCKEWGCRLGSSFTI